MAGDEVWFICRPQLDYNIAALRPGLLIPVQEPASVIFVPRSDPPPWEDARILLEEGDWP